MIYIVVREEYDCDPVDVPTEDVVGVARDDDELEEMMEDDYDKIEVDGL